MLRRAIKLGARVLLESGLTGVIMAVLNGYDLDVRVVVLIDSSAGELAYCLYSDLEVL